MCRGDGGVLIELLAGGGWDRTGLAIVWHRSQSLWSATVLQSSQSETARSNNVPCDINSNSEVQAVGRQAPPLSPLPPSFPRANWKDWFFPTRLPSPLSAASQRNMKTEIQGVYAALRPGTCPPLLPLEIPKQKNYLCPILYCWQQSVFYRRL